MGLRKSIINNSECKGKEGLAAFVVTSQVFRCGGVMTRNLLDRATGKSNDKDNAHAERIVGNNRSSHKYLHYDRVVKTL